MQAAPETRPVLAAERNRAQLQKGTGRVYCEGNLQGADQHVVLRHEGEPREKNRAREVTPSKKRRPEGCCY